MHHLCIWRSGLSPQLQKSIWLKCEPGRGPPASLVHSGLVPTVASAHCEKSPSLQHIIYLLECEDQERWGEGGRLFFFFPSLWPFFFAILLHSLVLSVQSPTEECFKERLVGQGWAWKSRIVRSHISQMQAGGESVAGGITPMNHAHCDAYRGWEHGKELGMAESYQLPVPSWLDARRKQPDSLSHPCWCGVSGTVEFLHCHVLLLKGVMQPSCLCTFPSTPVLLSVHFLHSHLPRDLCGRSWSSGNIRLHLLKHVRLCGEN